MNAPTTNFDLAFLTHEQSIDGVLGRDSASTEFGGANGSTIQQLDSAAFAWMNSKSFPKGGGKGVPRLARVLMIDAWKGCLISSVSILEEGDIFVLAQFHTFNHQHDLPRMLGRRNQASLKGGSADDTWGGQTQRPGDSIHSEATCTQEYASHLRDCHHCQLFSSLPQFDSNAHESVGMREPCQRLPSPRRNSVARLVRR